MLTMGRPIQLKCARNVGILGDLFGEKIRANYERMQGHIDPVEILHFLSELPEYYTAKTGVSRMAFTFQGRVFVENILKKFGMAGGGAPLDEQAALSLGRGEEIRRQLTHIDRQNKERVERLMEYAGRGRQSAAETGRGTENLREILGEETMRVFETIRGYQEDPERYPNVTASDRQAMNLLMRDIAAAGETRKAAFKVPSGRRARQSEDPVELFHRRNNQTVNEEWIQEFLQTQRKDRRIQNTNVQKVFQEKTQVEEIVRSKVNEMKGRQEEEIVRLINQNVRRQLDTLSEKVYGKLEKRMDAERRRRGV